MPVQTKVSKKQTSRKGKKAWSKNVDITVVEDNLHQLRTEERLGGKVHLKESKDLFFLDVEGCDKTRTAIKNKTLKVDDLLMPNSSIPALVSRVAKKSSMLVDVGHKHRQMSTSIKMKIERDALKMAKAGVLPGNGEKATKDRLRQKSENRKKKGGFDLWDTKAKDSELVDENDYLVEAKPKIPKKPVLRDQRPKHIPAVAIVHPGSSFNPAKEDHHNAILEAAEQEFEKLEKRDAVLEELAYPPELDDLPDETFFSEDDESEEDGENPTADTIEPEISKKKMKSKTRADINRQARLKESLANEKRMQEEKALFKQINKLKDISKQLTEKQQADLKRLEERKAAMELAANTQTKKLSRHTFRPTPIPIKLVEETADALIKLKPEGNLIQDRFESFQARNMIETRVVVKRRRKFELKEVETHDSKRFH